MPPLPVIALIIVVTIGITGSIQAPINAGLARHVHDVLLASFISMGTGTLILLGVVLVRGQWPGSAVMTSTSWWMWLGGTLGACYLVGMSWSVPHIGVLTAMGGVILGQMLGALVLDNIGAFGLPIHPVSPARIAAVMMIGGGLFLSRL